MPPCMQLHTRAFNCTLWRGWGPREPRRPWRAAAVPASQLFWGALAGPAKDDGGGERPDSGAFSAGLASRGAAGLTVALAAAFSSFSVTAVTVPRSVRVRTPVSFRLLGRDLRCRYARPCGVPRGTTWCGEKRSPNVRRRESDGGPSVASDARPAVATPSSEECAIAHAGVQLHTPDPRPGGSLHPARRRIPRVPRHTSGHVSPQHADDLKVRRGRSATVASGVVEYDAREVVTAGPRRSQPKQAWPGGGPAGPAGAKG